MMNTISRGQGAVDREKESLRTYMRINQAVDNLKRDKKNYDDRVKRGIDMLEDAKDLIAVNLNVPGDELPGIDVVDTLPPDVMRLIDDPCVQNIPTR